MQIAWRSFALVIFLAGCTARTVDLDDGGENPIDDPPPNDSVYIDAQSGAREVAVDDSRLYWIAESPDGAMTSVRSCVKSDCLGTLATYATGPELPSVGEISSIAVDFANVYWLDYRTNDSGGVTVAIMACARDGCDRQPTPIGKVPTSVDSLVSDGSHVYFYLSGEISRCPVNGCADHPETVVRGSIVASQTRFVVDRDHVYWISIDSAGSSSPASGSERSVWRAPKDGSGVPSMIAERQNYAAALAVNDTFVYWLNSYLAGTVTRCPLAGCGAAPEVVALNQRYPRILAVDDAGLYWFNNESNSTTPYGAGTVRGCAEPACATGLRSLASVQVVFYPSLAIDKDYVYWTVRSDPSGRPGYLPWGGICRGAR